jgi:hypothetical protein
MTRGRLVHAHLPVRFSGPRPSAGEYPITQLPRVGSQERYRTGPAAPSTIYRGTDANVRRLSLHGIMARVLPAGTPLEVPGLTALTYRLTVATGLNSVTEGLSAEAIFAANLTPHGRSPRLP